MKFTVYYIDEPAKTVVIEAHTAEMAGWQFVAQNPRNDASQLTVESTPSAARQPPDITHYRACDLVNRPAPRDEATPGLALQINHGPERAYDIRGSADSLRLLGTQLLRNLDEFPSRPNPLGIKNVYGVPLVDGSAFDSYLSFVIDPDGAKHKLPQPILHRFWTEYWRCLCLWILFLLACIGIWTIVRWIF